MSFASVRFGKLFTAANDHATGKRLQQQVHSINVILEIGFFLECLGTPFNLTGKHSAHFE